jgi:hypothetical protein
MEEAAGSRNLSTYSVNSGSGPDYQIIYQLNSPLCGGKV